MSKPEEKRRAIELRRQGRSYREILERVPVTKSTLSLRSVGLSQRQRQRLAAKKLAGARRGAKELRRGRLVRAVRTTAAAELEAARYLANRDLLWAVGTALYWAEGFKPKPWRSDIQAAMRHWTERLGPAGFHVPVRLKRHNPSPGRKNVGREYWSIMVRCR